MLLTRGQGWMKAIRAHRIVDDKFEFQVKFLEAAEPRWLPLGNVRRTIVPSSPASVCAMRRCPRWSTAAARASPSPTMGAAMDIVIASAWFPTR